MDKRYLADKFCVLEPLILDSTYSVKPIKARVSKLRPVGQNQPAAYCMASKMRMVFTVLKWLGKKLIFPDMWISYEIQILVFINKVLLECSHTHYLWTVCDCFCTTVGKLSSCYRNCLWHFHHFTFLFGMLKISDVDMNWQHLECCLCTTIFYYYFCYQFISMVSKKKMLFEWFAFKANWSMDYHIKVYVKRLFIIQWYYDYAKNIHYMLT